MNKCFLLGRLGQDPQFHENKYGKVCFFSLATQEKYIDKKTGEKKTITTWCKIQARNQKAEFCQKYLQKGLRVQIEATYRNKSQEDSTTGEKKDFSYFLLQTITPLDWKSQEEQSAYGDIQFNDSDFDLALS